jgi:riboflavin kinase/FMN adenylyltransferase
MSKVVAIGIFDGVHAGHQQIIANAKHNGDVTIMTFDPHPVSVVAPERTPSQLVPLKDRIELLKAAGATSVEVINFTKEFSQLSADQFIEDILVGRFAAEHVVIGENFKGGYLGFPEFKVLIKIMPGDFLLMDVHQYHCNTEIKLQTDGYRLSFVFYIREDMKICKTKKKIDQTVYII